MPQGWDSVTETSMGFGKDGKGVIFRQRTSITLGTLAAFTVVKQQNTPALVDSLRIIKSEGVASMSGAALVEGDGPIELWLVNDDLSITEIAEAIVSTAGQPLSREDRIGNERSMRAVFYLLTLPFVAGAAGSNELIHEWERTIRWTFGDESAFSIVAINAGSGALTTGGRVDFYHTAYGVWVGA